MLCAVLAADYCREIWQYKVEMAKEAVSDYKSDTKGEYEKAKDDHIRFGTSIDAYYHVNAANKSGKSGDIKKAEVARAIAETGESPEIMRHLIDQFGSEKLKAGYNYALRHDIDPVEFLNNYAEILDEAGKNSNDTTKGIELLTYADENKLTDTEIDAFIRVFNSKDKGKAVKEACSVGCIGCTLCTKQCEFGAITMNGTMNS